jgi:glucose-1-phosphate cytidylyltransferase
MKVLILCGGEGIRLKHMLEPIPKAMVMIGTKPMIWHVMKIFSKFGYNEFVLALGSGGETIRDYFINYNLFSNDITLELGNKDIKLNSQNQEKNWKITFVDTGEQAGTGARILRCKNYLNEDSFFISYSDCLSNVDVNKVLEKNKTSNKIITITGIFPPFRYGEFILKNDEPIDYNPISKLKSIHGLVNGGFMVAKKEIFNYLEPFNECILETNVFKKLVSNHQINIHKHDEYWQCLDNDREYAILNNFYEKNQQWWLF